MCYLLHNNIDFRLKYKNLVNHIKTTIIKWKTDNLHILVSLKYCYFRNGYNCTQFLKFCVQILLDYFIQLNIFYFITKHPYLLPYSFERAYLLLKWKKVWFLINQVQPISQLSISSFWTSKCNLWHELKTKCLVFCKVYYKMRLNIFYK